MIARMLSGRRVPAALQRVDRPQAIALAAVIEPSSMKDIG